MKAKGLTKNSITNTGKALTYLSKRMNLQNPEAVKLRIANLSVTEGTKRNLCYAYSKYAQYYKLEFTKPKYHQNSKQPKIPTDERVNQIIAAAGKILGTKLQLSKETGLRPIELCNLRVKDIDLDQRTRARSYQLARAYKIRPTKRVKTQKFHSRKANQVTHAHMKTPDE